MEASRERSFVSRSVAATEALGQALGAGLAEGTVVALIGELGGGKTTLVRGLARGLGIEEPVTSPSFTLMHEYAGPLPLYHFDAWMAGREIVFLEGGGADYLGSDGVAVVEWADRIQALLPAPRLEIAFQHREPDTRRLELRIVPAEAGAGEPARARQAALESLLGNLPPVEGLDPVSTAGEAGTQGRHEV